jgi:hypothetical protein
MADMAAMIEPIANGNTAPNVNVMPTTNPSTHSARYTGKRVPTTNMPKNKNAAAFS